MSNPIIYTCDPDNQVWKAAGQADIPFDPAPAPPGDPFTWPFSASEPWRTTSGESIYDNMPIGVPVVNAQNYSTSTDLYTVLNAIETTETRGVYVQLEAKTYYVNSLRDYGTNYWHGFINVNRRVMGLIGAAPTTGGDLLTRIQTSPTMVSSSTGARAYALSPPTSWTPIPITVMYLSNTNTTVPVFISGIDFRGTLQTPFGVYSAAVQSAKFDRNKAVSSPLPWSGISVWRTVAKSRVQHCRFAGFSYTLNTSPPFETGALNSSYGRETVRRIEIDGRVLASIDAARPRASGGFMVNKGQDTRWEDSYQHHTRRSGWATNTNTNSQAERYTGKRVRIDNVASSGALDGYAGDNGLFAGSNVEEVVGVFTYDTCWLSTDPVRGHINLLEPYRAGNGQVLVLPNFPIVVVRGGFKTDDTLYGGCLRIAVGKNPNSTGTSPAWTKLNTLGIAGSGLFDIKNAAGQAMTGVRSTAWNSSMTPSTHYVVTYSN